jgi:hydrogenase maturation protease
VTPDEHTGTPLKTVVLGLGNILLGDEGVGVHVVEELRRSGGLPGVELVDGGTAGYSLLPFFDDAGLVVVVDAAADGAPAGTVALTRPAFSEAFPPVLAPHDFGLKNILDALALTGVRPEIVLLTVSVAEADRASLELSPPVAAAVPDAAEQIRRLLTRPAESSTFR